MSQVPTQAHINAAALYGWQIIEWGPISADGLAMWALLRRIEWGQDLDVYARAPLCAPVELWLERFEALRRKDYTTLSRQNFEWERRYS